MILIAFLESREKVDRKVTSKTEVTLQESE